MASIFRGDFIEYGDVGRRPSCRVAQLGFSGPRKDVAICRVWQYRSWSQDRGAREVGAGVNQKTGSRYHSEESAGRFRPLESSLRHVGPGREKQPKIGVNIRMKQEKNAEDLRSYRWLGRDDLRSSGHRSRVKQAGYAQEDYAGKPVIAILNTWSDLIPCHSHFRVRAEEVKRGVWQAGGFPVEIPALAISETFMKPSPMMYRNLLAMEVEELLRSQPIDGVVLMGGCDKTTPGLLMGAISMNLPAIFLPAGPMLRGNWNGQPLGSGTDLWKFWTERCAGTVSEEDWNAIENGIARSAGHCMTMGTASTMTAIAETLGLTLPGASSIPAVDANHPRMASQCGRRIVEMVW